MSGLAAVTDAPSWWWADLGGLPAPRPALDGDREADVCIVGAGYTGLWTAYELLRADPSLAVVVLEREVAGFGASGRNGGWVLGEVSTGSRQRAAAGEAAIGALERAAQETVDEVGAACAREGIDCDFVKGGSLTVAQTAPQLARLRAAPRGELARRSTTPLRARARRGAARRALHAALRARAAGQARARPGGGGRAPRRDDPRGHAGARRSPRARVRTAVGRPCARAGSCAPPRATRPALPGLRARAAAAVELDDRHRAARRRDVGADRLGGLRDRSTTPPTPTSTRSARPTGGSPSAAAGAPTASARAPTARGEIPDATVRQLRARLTRLFPVLRDVAPRRRVDRRLRRRRATGPPRSHCDRDSGLCWAGGYAGEGVAAANLAARTLRDLILGRDTELARLPWVGHRARGWEPEPLRWLAVQTVYGAFRAADAIEDRTGKPSRLAGPRGRWRAASSTARQRARGEPGQQDLDRRLAPRALGLLAQQPHVGLHLVEPAPGADGLPRARP